MTKILFITTSYILKNSSAAIRNNSLVKGFIELGYNVDVYTVDWPADLKSDFFLGEKNGHLYFTQLPNLQRINQVKTKMNRPQKQFRFPALRKLVKTLLFFPDECGQWPNRFTCSDLAKYDCLITSSDHKSSHFVGLKIKSAYPHLRWLQIWGDPWNTDINTPWLLKRRTAYYERRLLEKADSVVYVSLPTHEVMTTKYPMLASKMYYIPRGFYQECTEQTATTDGKYVIVYTGVISFGRNIFPLLQALHANSIWCDKIKVDIYGQYTAEIEKKLKQYPFVNLKGNTDFHQMLPVYASASLLLYLSNKQGSSQIPGKLYDYFGTTKPILCLVEDEEEATSLFLKRFNRCHVIRNNQEDIECSLARLFVSLPVSYPVENEFSPSAIAIQFEKILR